MFLMFMNFVSPLKTLRYSHKYYVQGLYNYFKNNEILREQFVIWSSNFTFNYHIDMLYGKGLIVLRFTKQLIKQLIYVRRFKVLLHAPFRSIYENRLTVCYSDLKLKTLSEKLMTFL